MQNVHIEFGKIYVITVYHKDIYGRYRTQKGNKDYFRPYFDIIVFKMKRSSFPVVEDKQTQPRFLPLAIFSLVCPLRNHVTSHLSHQSLSTCKDDGYRE